MDKQGKKALVPRLRFPEFCEDRPWSFQPLGKLARRSTKKNADGDITRVLTNSAEYGVIDQRDFFDKDIANQGNLEGYYIVEMGDYVYNPRISVKAPVGPISKNRIGLGVMSPLYTVFRFGDKQNDFYAHYFKSTHWHHYMRQASSTGARHDRMSITNDDFMGLPLPVSKPEEQQKIADCLSSLDEVIAAENQKLETLKTYKKGLMQQLFPREGETVPRLRFPEFRNAPEWEEKQLAELGEIITGKTPSTTDSDLWGGDVLFITPTDIDEDGKYQETSQRTVVATTGLKLLPTGSIAYTCIASIGKLAITVHPSITNQQINSVVVRSDVENEFIYYVLVHLTPSIKSIPATSTLPIINKTDFSKINIWIPVDRAEQKAIADCLSSLDELITTQSQKIDGLKTHKKGLMQQLFPVLDEVPA